MLPNRFLENLLRESLAQHLPDADTASVLVRPCPDPQFGDYQSSALISLAKERKLNPRQLATDIASKLALPDWAKVEIAGPGFLNFRLSPSILEESLRSAMRGEHLFFEPTRKPRTVVIDFSSPNVAKPMHVGHIRSTILGDCLARVFRLLGDAVIADNHIGDWGTQFGKLLVGWKEHLDQSALQADPITELERLYKLVNTESEKNPDVLERARSELVKLQNGDPENLGIWRQMIALSQRQFDEIYGRMGVRFDQTLGESVYNPQLKSVVQQLLGAGLARETEGAIAVFFERFPDLKPHPALIQKSDGAFNYMTTDLAALQYRMETWSPDEIIYVTDGRQQLHFKQLFAIFRGWQPECQVNLKHVWFGAILGEDGKPFKTRAGDIIKLSDLLDEAETRAFEIVSAKAEERASRTAADGGLELSQAERKEIARLVGIGAVKYSDLLPNRQSDYVFSWDKMLAFNGNTAPYLQDAYARIRSIFRRLETEESVTDLLQSAATSRLNLSIAEEITLVKHLLNFGIVLEAVADEHRPNYLCNYLYDLAGLLTKFYETCPVLKAEGDTRLARLVLCHLAGRVLWQGLQVLGIEALEKM